MTKPPTIKINPQTLDLLTLMSQQMNLPVEKIAHEAVLRFAKHILPGSQLAPFLTEE